MSTRHKHAEDASTDVLPRSLYVPKSDPRENIREIVNTVFSDRFMIFLSLIMVPLILIPFIFDLTPAILSFLDICDWIIITLFVTEYVTKLYAAENRWKHFKAPWHLIDLIIIALPFLQYVIIFESISGSPSLLLRLLRIPRAVAIGSRAVAGRKLGSSIESTLPVSGPTVTIRQVESNLTTKHNLTWDELKTHLKENKSEEWLDLNNMSNEGFAELSKILGIPEPHFKSAIVDEIYPHIDYIQKSSFIFLQSGKIQYPEYADNFMTISRSGIIVICSGSKIITVSRHNIDLLTPVLSSIQQSRQGTGFVVSVLYGLLDYMLNDYRSVLSEIELEILRISSTPRSKLPKDFLERVYQLDKEVSRLVSNLMHFKDTLSVIISKKVPLEGFDKSSEEAFQVLQDGAEYLNEMAHDLIENLRSIIDLYINQTSFEANKILKILAVITAISVVPSAVSGLLGTNMIDAPYGATLWQLSFVIGVCVSFVAYVFVKLGWLKS
jgi:Mg2+ and Co2+ transporter CorA